ncbi:MAG: ADP-heptose--LPS heptosyltransferase RfaF [Pseudozobellia sp.]|nr:ADP-heptose--LPS heptosyltransferase RfaF [Pseudozobellia sp.]MBG49176.1 ADP-heptose--LPS heptosyltransferase RfaF [Pseudozobellia sp.]
MGDVAMTVPVLKALQQRYPDLVLTVLTRKFFAPMFFQLSNVKVFEADVKGRHKGVLGLWKLYKELKSQNLDGVADLHNVLRSNILKKYFALTTIPFKQINKGRSEKKALTSGGKGAFVPLKSTHARYANVFAKLGYPFELKGDFSLDREKCPEAAVKIIGGEAKPWIGIAPFAAFEGKMYPKELMEQVIQQLSSTNRYKILLFGGGQYEKEILAQWQLKFDDVFSMVGILSFQEELALISNLDIMLSMDSGNGHLAAMYGIPVVTLWGVTHPYAGFAPFGQNEENSILSDREKYPLIPTSVYGNKMPNGYDKAMESISPSKVVNKVEQILSKE